MPPSSLHWIDLQHLIQDQVVFKPPVDCIGCGYTTYLAFRYLNEDYSDKRGVYIGVCEHCRMEYKFPGTSRDHHAGKLQKLMEDYVRARDCPWGTPTKEALC